MRHPSEYVLVGDVGGKHLHPVHGRDHLRRIAPKAVIPCDYIVVTSLFGKSVYDESGRLDPKFWALIRITPTEKCCR